ncbi:MAG: FAD-binding oxidoreductase [Ignavibacterium sp.]|nr:MAG: FAD-binding oxidoreductase [Ignavibacterium sp.]
MLDSKTIEEFGANLRGDIVQPSDDNYDEARKVYNGMIDKKPALFAYCENVADVITAVNVGRENNMLISVRGGGHNAGGLGIADDALVIDLFRIRYVRVDPKSQTVRVGGGSKWGDVDHAAFPFGLAVPAGIISTTGVAGLALGGGVGYLSRKYGLTIDNILEVDMVLADGSFVTANKDENADLYWAVRGGGGNFGIITSFLFKGNPIHTNYSGPTLWHIDKSEEILKWYREFIVKQPDDVYGFFAFLTVPGPPFPEELHGKKMCGVVWNYTGPEKDFEKAFKPVRDLKPDFEHVGPIPHPALQSMFDVFYPTGLQWYWRADFIKEINDDAVAEHVKYGNELPSPHSTMHLYPIDGAASRVSNSDTPWAYRDSKFAQVIVGVDPDPANNDAITNWTKDYYEAIHPYSAGGAYVNFMMDEGEERVKATYGDNYDRLVKIKNKYDPTNLFRVNQNIKPNGA